MSANSKAGSMVAPGPNEQVLKDRLREMLS
jgi:hypothetical protein